ncbi:hypothetical protein V6259_17995 [Marinomonas sp. TI.3.20]|uniref:hypothetical protein n=1 Tax=Marinomonas sp. TI.3.20 TaxID=3121296 RepID=UPI00311F21C4
MISIEYSQETDLFETLKAKGYNDLQKANFISKLMACIDQVPNDAQPCRIVVSNNKTGFVGITAPNKRGQYTGAYLHGAMTRARRLFETSNEVQWIINDIELQCKKLHATCDTNDADSNKRFTDHGSLTIH